MTFDYTPDTVRRSRRHRPTPNTAPARAHIPRRGDVILTPFRTVSVSRNREVRVSTSASSTGRAVVLQAYGREGSTGPMVEIGRRFTVFPAEISAVVAALTDAGATLDRAPD